MVELVIPVLMFLCCLSGDEATRAAIFFVLRGGENLPAEEGPHLLQIDTAELPLWVERKQSLGLAAAQAAKSSEVVQGS